VNYRTIALISAAALGVRACSISIAAANDPAVTALHAEGAQIYECKIASDGTLAWQLREPIATLLLDGKTVGRHYAGPSWEYVDDSRVTAKPVESTADETPADIPWLRLEVVDQRGTGALSGVTSVQRINTRGGVVSGACEQAGTYLSARYSADYLFLRK
jgi:Protein of unknown function (DUF3455)